MFDGFRQKERSFERRLNSLSERGTLETLIAIFVLMLILCSSIVFLCFDSHCLQNCSFVVASSVIFSLSHHDTLVSNSAYKFLVISLVTGPSVKVIAITLTTILGSCLALAKSEDMTCLTAT